MLTTDLVHYNNKVETISDLRFIIFSCLCVTLPVSYYWGGVIGRGSQGVIQKLGVLTLLGSGKLPGLYASSGGMFTGTNDMQ